MKTTLRLIAVTLFWLAVWQGAYLMVGQSLLVPAPLEVGAALLRLSGEAGFWRSALFSLARIMAGFALGVGGGVLLALLTEASPVARALLTPLFSTIKATPVASFIILALVWLRVAQIPAFTAFLIVLPLVWGNTVAGLRAADAQLLEMGRAFGLNQRQQLRSIRLPALRPYLLTAAGTGLGMAWKAGIAAEVIVSPKNSLGSALYDAKIYLDTTELFALTVVIVLLSMALEKLLLYVSSRGRRRAHA